MNVASKRVLGMLLALEAALCGTAAAQLDETWTVTVAGRSVPVNADGSFRIRNVPVGNDFLRVIAHSDAGGKTRYAASEFFTLGVSSTAVVGGLTPRPGPPLAVASLVAAPDRRRLTAVHQTTQVRVTATLADGTRRNVTPAARWTAYRTSNPRVATVDKDGQVTAVGRGAAAITAVNDGASATALILVEPAATTTAVGHVLRQNGTPLPGARVQVLGVQGTQSTGPLGRFRFTGVPANVTSLQAIATSGSAEGFSLAVEPIADGVTDLGIIVPATPSSGFFNGGFETGDLSGFFARGDARVVTRLGSLSPPEGKHMLLARTPKDAVGGGFGKLSRPQLRIPANAKWLSFRFNLLTNDVRVLDAFRGGFDPFGLGLVVGIPGSSTPAGVVATTTMMRVGSLPNKPGTGGYQRQTGFLTGKLDVTPMAGKTLPYDFCLRIEHTPLGPAAGSAVLIDDLRFLTQ